MINFRWEDVRLRRAALLALLLVAIALSVHEIFGDRGYLALRRRQQELHSLRDQVRRLEEENQKLEQQIKALKTDPKAIERLAREQMKLARPGEIIYVLPEKKDAGAANRGKTLENSPPRTSNKK